MIGSHRELFLDRILIEGISGDIDFSFHHPVAREVAIVHDAPWEGNGCGPSTVFKDDDIFRMYYKTDQYSIDNGKLVHPHKSYIAYAESPDGVHWIKPNLGFVAYGGSKENNIVLEGSNTRGFSPFKDGNPDCAQDARYKALGWGNGGLFPFQSPDGFHWKLMTNKPIIIGPRFDSQNLAFWDQNAGIYRAYYRSMQGEFRAVGTAISKDFLHWTNEEWLSYPGSPEEQLYTNQILPYYRAPHIYLGFPTRYVEREWNGAFDSLPDREQRTIRAAVNQRFGSGLTDALFMWSRDGRAFTRWKTAFLTPGEHGTDNWMYGDCYLSWQFLETTSLYGGNPPELSFYSTESLWTGTESHQRRYTIRVDGFVSIDASNKGGEFITKPLVFTGDQLSLNFATSAAGCIKVEIQDAKGNPISGYCLNECLELFGDDHNRIVRWKNGATVGNLSGKPVKLRFFLKEAEIYSFVFGENR
ncbi:MAG: hypothetical protein ACYC9O_08345 [Candidatus Latescibacterota bacterium]